MDRGAENGNAHSKQWTLQPESEYRFELDPGTSFAIKVCPLYYAFSYSVGEVTLGGDA